VLQAPVVVTSALIASGFGAAPETKALAVVPAAVAGSFGIAWLLTRIPGVRRIL